MRRTILTLLSLIMLVALAVPTPPATAGAKIDVTVVMHNARNEEIVWGIANRIKNDLEKNSNGEMAVRLLGPEVGGERDLQEGTSRNEFQIFQSGDMAVSTYGVKYAVMSAPFLFPGYDAVDKVYKGKLGEKLNEALVKNGNLRILGLSRRGARLLTASKPIPSPAEVKGLKLRVPEIPQWVAIWKELGALPTPVAWPEVFTALQTGVVNGQENPVLQIYEGKLYEVQKFVMMTEHISSYFHWVANEKFLQGLSQANRKLVGDVVKSAADWGSTKQVEKAAELRAIMEKQYGVKFIEVDKPKFTQAARPAIERIATEQWAPEVKDLLKEIGAW
ncbi:MAG: TRAP transporter substrate-binding protein [candidate division NC10 bacterium]|nr:TRAP transporter substrate-binding protein [candidate division NC10 bacterium]